MKTTKCKLVVWSLLLIFFTACGPDDEPAKELTLEKNAITLSEGESAFVSITSGNGNYKASSSDEKVATATPSNKIEIVANSYGIAIITITDAEYKKATITVTVTSGALKDSDLRFEWDGLKVLLDKKANGWGKTQKYGGGFDIGVVNLTQKKSLRTQGLTSLSKGVKTGVKLLIVDNGGTEQSIALDKFEVIDVTSGVFTAVASKEGKKLVIRDYIPN